MEILFSGITHVDIQGEHVLTFEDVNDEYVTYYSYKLDKYPHAGAGKRVQFSWDYILMN